MPVDVSGVAVDIASMASPILDITNLVAATRYRVFQSTGPGGTFWRVYSSQNEYIVTLNASTANGSLYTKDVDTVVSTVFYMDNTGVNYYQSNSDSAAHTWTAGSGGSASAGWQWRAADSMFGVWPNTIGSSGLTVSCGGTVNNCTVGQTVQFPLSFGMYIGSGTPTSFTFTSDVVVNTMLSPTVTNANNVGAVINCTAIAAGTLTWVGKCKIRR